jgi:hypothetical protein
MGSPLHRDRLCRILAEAEIPFEVLPPTYEGGFSRVRITDLDTVTFCFLVEDQTLMSIYSET